LLGITGSLVQTNKERLRTPLALLNCSRPEKSFIWLANADHLGFSDSTGSGQRSLPSKSRADAQPLVRAATLLFFEATLRGDKEAEKALSYESLSPLLRGVVNELEIQKK
jgi:hypothetical protein